MEVLMNIGAILSCIAILITLLGLLIAYQYKAIASHEKNIKKSAKKIRNIFIVLFLLACIGSFLVIKYVFEENNKETKNVMSLIPPELEVTYLPPTSSPYSEDITNSSDKLLYIQLRDIYIKAKWKDGSFSYQGYNSDLDCKILIHGVDCKGNITWSKAASYIGDGLYYCKIQSVNDLLFICKKFNEQTISIDELDNYLKKESPYRIYLDNKSLIKVDWKKGSMDEVVGIACLGSEIIGNIDLSNNLQELWVVPNLMYTVFYTNGVHQLASFDEEGVYDFTLGSY